MLKVPIIYIKDKQAFTKVDSNLQLIGPAVESIKKLGERYKLFHICDLDLKKGNLANLDVYDKLTYTTHIQVECEEKKAIEKLLKMNARVVIRLPTNLLLEKFNKKLLVGIVNDKNADVSNVNDVIIDYDDKKAIWHYKNKEKRILIHENKWDKKTKVWAIILSAP